VLFCGIKKQIRDESETKFSRKKQWILPIFETFMRYRINLGIDKIIWPIHMYLSMFKECPDNK
jgi:hypothetical protein